MHAYRAKRCQFPNSHRPSPELAAQDAENGTHRCQFPNSHRPSRELAAQDAENGTHRCQFIAGR